MKGLDQDAQGIASDLRQVLEKTSPEFQRAMQLVAPSLMLRVHVSLQSLNPAAGLAALLQLVAIQVHAMAKTMIDTPEESPLRSRTEALQAEANAVAVNLHKSTSEAVLFLSRLFDAVESAADAANEEAS